MAYHFTASRISGDGNAIFPDKIIIDTDENRVTYQKGTLLGYKTTSLRFTAIGCVSMSEGILFRDITIETNGGQQIKARGFTTFDAKRIVELLN
jgi:hypothetical protein